MIKVDKAMMQSLLEKHRQIMRAGDPEYHLECTIQETLAEILASQEKTGLLFRTYLKQEEEERLEYYIYCYKWGQVMGIPERNQVTLDSFPSLPERKAHTEQIDQLVKKEGGQLRRLWRRYQTAIWKRRVYEGAYMATLGVEAGKSQ